MSAQQSFSQCPYHKLFCVSFDQFRSKAWDSQESKLHQAMNYCVSGEGKKVRAKIAMLVCESYGRDFRAALPAAVAIEMVHAYSLAHDDLPCMDDDDMRRGRPSLHVAFGEAVALLAGDALLTDAFRVLSDVSFFADAGMLSESARLRSVVELSRAAGSSGMVLGQDLDMTWTGRAGYDKKILDSIHCGKTGALMGASFAMGAIGANAPENEVLAWRKVGILTGLAFQAIDDTIDLEVGTGKSAGKDVDQGKLTYLSFYNVETIKQMALQYTEEATALIPKSVDSTKIRHLMQQLIFRSK